MPTAPPPTGHLVRLVDMGMPPPWGLLARCVDLAEGAEHTWVDPLHAVWVCVIVADTQSSVPDDI